MKVWVRDKQRKFKNVEDEKIDFGLVNHFMVFEDRGEVILFFNNCAGPMGNPLFFAIGQEFGLTKKNCVGGGDVRTTRRMSRWERTISASTWISGETIRMSDGLHQQVIDYFESLGEAVCKRG